jgi:hypothetical protein
MPAVTLSDGILPALVGLVMGLVAFAVGWFALGMQQRRRYDTEGGLELLRTLRWREFVALLRELFRARGYEATDIAAPVGQGGVDLELANATGRMLVRIKHGDAYHVGDKELAELDDLVRRDGAATGVLVTSGHGTASLARALSPRPIELLDGERLWTEMRVLLKPEQLEQARHCTRQLRRRAWRRVGSFAVASLLLGASATFVGQTWFGARQQAVAQTAADPGLLPNRGPVGDPVTVPAPADAQRVASRQRELDLLRQRALDDVLGIDGVRHAEWSTHSTLKVDVNGVAGTKLEATLATAHHQACSLMAGYTDLASIRIELHGVDPKTGNVGPARWRLCENAK